jgi:hypothetical protein
MENISRTCARTSTHIHADISDIRRYNESTYNGDKSNYQTYSWEWDEWSDDNDDDYMISAVANAAAVSFTGDRDHKMTNMA